jgi:hypothetical protein
MTVAEAKPGPALYTYIDTDGVSKEKRSEPQAKPGPALYTYIGTDGKY